MPATQRIPTITQKQVASFLSTRPRDSHKGKFGTVAVIGGASGMVGAPLLAARATLKLGAGCVHVGMLADNAPSVDILQPELMLHNAQTALRLPKLDVLAIGCGMGHDDVAHKIMQDALKLDTVLVLDADALNILALRPDLRTVLLSRKDDSVITPHPGEAARLLGCKTEEVQTARSEAAQELAKRFNSAVVLKGAHSL
ncbi:MAG: NAD(P)H-hydrate dehydratase, partial [Candidatus Nitrotoga sp.]